MVTFQVVGSYSDAPARFLSGITDIELVQTANGLVLHSTTRAGGGMLAFAVDAPSAGLTGLTLLDSQVLEPGENLSVPMRLQRIALAGRDCLLLTGCQDSVMGGFALTAAGRFGQAVQLPGSPLGSVVSATSLLRDGETFLFQNNLGSDVISSWRVGLDGQVVWLADQVLPDTMQGIDVTAMQPVRLLGGDFLLALSASGNALLSFRIGADGRLTQVSSLGAAGGLGISAPSALCLAEAGGQSYALVAAAGSSSIVVVALEAQGRLSVSDHVIDTLDTRFQRISVMTSVEVQGRSFILAGGGDDGITLFTLLPNGRLLNLGQQLKQAGLPLDNLTALEARAVGGQIEVFAAGEGTGLMRLRINLGALAAPQLGGTANATLTGNTQGDLLSGGAGNEVLRGLEGDDILMDGAGSDVLWGGAGADVFVLAADGHSDVIRDFELGVDRIDLSGWGRLYDLSAVSIKRYSAGHITLTWQSESLTIYPVGEVKLTYNSFSRGALFQLWHVVAEPVYEGLHLEGSAQDDTQLGGAGADTFRGSAGNDVIEGRAGFDLVDYSGYDTALLVDLENDAAHQGGASGDVLVGIEGVIGGAGDDTLAGSGEGNLLRGLGGEDLLMGRAGTDTLHGGAGNDRLEGGLGRDKLVGGLGQDEASYDSDEAGLRADLANPLSNSGQAGGDSYEGVEDLRGGRGDDSLGGDGGNNQLTGLAGDDLLLGRGGADVLFGGDGADGLQGDAGDDTLFGGGGVDVFLFTGEGGVVVDLALGTAVAAQGVDVLHEIENVVSGEGDDQLKGTAGANRLEGGLGQDSLFGGDGDDRLSGGGGNDWIEGGAGRDWALFEGAAGVRVDLIEGRATGQGEDRLIGVEHLLGGSGADQLLGDGQSNTLAGAEGDDLLQGRDGQDRLEGGAGHDSLAGGAGNDRMDGGAGRDLVSFADAGRQDIAVRLGVTRAQATGQGQDILRGIEDVITAAGNDRLIGTGGGNRLMAGAGEDELQGGGGDDQVFGGAGNDRLWADAGNDLLHGGAGHDWLIFGGSEGISLRLGPSGEQRTGLGRDRVASIESVQTGGGKDALSGDGGSNSLRSGGGNDQLWGGGGADRLEGGEGHDRLTGGAGADRFVWSAGRDRISDFSATERDQILLDVGAAMTRQRLLDRYTENTRQGLVIDLPGAENSLLIEGLHDIDLLARHLLLI
ncbi:calcium-binding protein [Neogemmobacter tilapiae]|uniref:calcium-binding protein n=1 Tax=Neogemmobacter tilapiae TaxID=875041 RepID=UPI0016750A42|nr:M10 family metallopeptidase C-terminal domain-containing protein [Gemmobacter tilapiae]